MGVVRRAHPVRGELHIQRNANRGCNNLQLVLYFLEDGPFWSSFIRDKSAKGFSRPGACTNLTLRNYNAPIIRIRLCSLAILLWRGSGRGMVAQAGADIGILVAMVVCCGVVVWVGRCAVVAMAVDYVGPDLDFEVPELVLVLFLFSILRRRNLSWSSFLFWILRRQTSSWSSSLFLSLILRRRNSSWSSSLFLFLILRCRNSSWSSSLFLFLILSRRTSSWSSSLFLSLFSGGATCPGPLLVWILNRFPHFVVIGKPSKASHCGSKQHAMITLRVC